MMPSLKHSVTVYCYSSMFEAILHDHSQGVLFNRHVTRVFINKSGVASSFLWHKNIYIYTKFGFIVLFSLFL